METFRSCKPVLEKKLEQKVDDITFLELKSCH